MSLRRKLSQLTVLIPLVLITTMIWHREAHAAQLDLTWSDISNNEDGFKIERKTGTSGTFAQIAMVGPDITTYTDSVLASQTTYCYRVRAFNTFGDSDYSNADCSITAWVPAQLVFVTEPGNSTAGQALGTQVVVEVRDALGNTATADPNGGVTETVTVAFTAGTNEEGTLSGTTTANINWATGQATFSDLSVDLIGSYQLTATTNLGSLTADSSAFTVEPGLLDHFLVEAAGGGAIPTQTAGSAFNIQITAQDTNNNTVTGFNGATNTVVSYLHWHL